MAQLRKVEGQIEIKSNAMKFFDAWAHKLFFNCKDLCPNKISKVELQGGTRHVDGSIIEWTYIPHGNCEVGKTKTQRIDEENLSVAYENIDGNIISKLYKSMKSRIQVIPKGEGSTVKWTFEYEKMNDNIPDAHMYMDFILSCAKDIDDHLCNA